MDLSHFSPKSRGRASGAGLAAHVFVWTAITCVSLLNLGVSIRADDVWSLKTASLPLPELLAAIRADVHPPLYFLLLKPWITLFGTTESASRLLSVLFHFGACVLMYALGRRLAGRGMGLLCAAIYAFAPLAVLSAELVRMYSLAGLLSAAAVLLWNAAATGPVPRRTWAFLIVVIVLGSFTHIWFLCLAAALCAASLIHFPRRAIWTIGAISAAMLPFAFLWLPALLAQVGRSGDSAAWLKPPSLPMLGEMMFLHLGVIPVFLLFFISARFRRREPLSAAPRWAVTVYAATLLPPLLISFHTPFFYPRFTVVALPALAVVIAALLSRIEPPALAASIAGAALLLFGGSRLSAPSCDASSAAQALQTHVSSGDVVVYGSLSRPAIDFYLDRLAPRRTWREQSFPVIIDAHPGYEGSHLRADDLDPLRAEAAATASGFTQSGVRRIFYLAGYRRQIDTILSEALNRQFGPPSTLIACGKGDYFREILVFERRPGQLTPSPDPPRP